MKRVLTRGFLRELGRGFRGHISGFRGAAGIVVCLWLTGIGYLRGRMGHRARVAKVAAHRRDRALEPLDPPVDS